MDEKQLKEAYASLVKEGKWQAVAELITEFVEPHHLTVDVISLLLNSRNLNPGK